MGLSRILCAEDESDILEIMIMSLESIGKFEVMACPNGVIALQRIEDFKPDLVILDVMMPEMDGLTTMAEIRKLPIGKELPIVFMTAKVQSHEVSEYEEKGAIGFISKPFDPLTLPDQLKELWEQKVAN